MNRHIKFGLIGLLIIDLNVAVADMLTAANPLIQPAPFSAAFKSLSSAKFDDDSISNIEFSVNEVKLNGTFSGIKSGDGMFIIGGEFRYTEYQFNSDLADDNQLYEIALPMTYITGTSDLRHIVRVAPGIKSDFEDLSGDDITLTAFYQANFVSSATLTWVLGAGVGHQFGESQAFPLMGAIYQPNEEWRFNLVLPQLEATYIASDNNLWYFSLIPSGRSWNVENENDLTDVDIITEEIRLALGTVYAINKNLALRAEVGSATGRNLEFTMSNGDEVDVDVEDTSFIGVTLEYRP